MNTMKKVSIIFITLLTLGLGLVSCSDGEDGLPGPNGDPGLAGADGNPGDPGTDGNDGSNGVGYDEMVQYGSVTVNLEGIRPDGELFENAVEFKFTSKDEFLLDGINLLDNVTSLSHVRFLSTPDNAYQNTFQTSELSVANLGEADESFTNFIYTISNFAVVGEDNKYFVLHLEFGQADPSDIVQDFVFDPAENHLTYTYSFVVNSENNTSGHDLNVSGEVDVYLLDEL